MAFKVDKVKESKIKEKSEAVVHAFCDASSKKTDPMGSYTGKAVNKYEEPVQDADDL